MEIKHRLIRGEVVKCHNSLLTDVRLEDENVVPAFCGFSDLNRICMPGTEVYLKRHRPPRIVEYEIELVAQGKGLVAVNPLYSKLLFQEAFKKGMITELKHYKICQDFENNSVIEENGFILLGSRNQKCVVFIEEVCINLDGFSVFPAGSDSFKIKTIESLSSLHKKGYRTIVMMIVPRNDTKETKFSWTQNPVAAAKIFDEAKNGLEFICYGCNIDKKSISINRSMNIIY